MTTVAKTKMSLISANMQSFITCGRKKAAGGVGITVVNVNYFSRPITFKRLMLLKNCRVKT